MGKKTRKPKRLDKKNKDTSHDQQKNQIFNLAEEEESIFEISDIDSTTSSENQSATNQTENSPPAPSFTLYPKLNLLAQGFLLTTQTMRRQTIGTATNFARKLSNDKLRPKSPDNSSSSNSDKTVKWARKINREQKTEGDNKLTNTYSATSLSKIGSSIKTDDLRDLLDAFEGRGQLIIDGDENSSLNLPSRIQSEEDLTNSALAQIELGNSKSVDEVLKQVNRSFMHRTSSLKTISLDTHEEETSTDSHGFLHIKHSPKPSTSHAERLENIEEENNKKNNEEKGRFPS